MGKYGISTLTGPVEFYDAAGHRVSGIGDINGDGFEDFAITERDGRSYGYDTYYGGTYTQPGRVYIVFGSDTLPLETDLGSLDGTDGFVIEADPALASGGGGFYGGDSYGTLFGSSITALGDVNGDGVDDFGIAQNARYTQSGAYSGGYYGGYGYYSYNGYYHSTRTDGVAYVIYGGQFDGVGANHDVTDFEHFRIDVSGEITSMVALGDVNGDGFADIAVNAKERSSYYSGYVTETFFYDANDNGIYDYDYDTNPDETGFSNTRYVSVSEVTGYVIFGTDAARESDFGEGSSEITLDGDGLDGTDGFRVNAGQVIDRGNAYYYEGGVATAAFSVASGGVGIGDDYGYYGEERYELGIVGAADIDGDGFADVVYATGGVEVGDEERFRRPGQYGYYNQTSYNDGTFQFGSGAGIIDGSGVGGSENEFRDARFFGFFVEPGNLAALGDVSGGDGFAEIAGTDFQDGTTAGLEAMGTLRASGVTVFNGAADRLDDLDFGGDGDFAAGTAAFYYSATQNGSNATLSDFFPEAVLSTGDVTGDGIGDFAIIGDSFTAYPGRVVAYLVAGTEEVRSGAIDLDALVASGGAYRIVGEAGSSFDPLWIAPAGDVDGDGAADILIGDRQGENGNGRAQILFGGDALEALDEADGLDDNTAFTENGEVDVETGLLPIRISITPDTAFLNEGTGTGPDGVTDFVYTVFRTGDLTATVTVDFEVVPGGRSAFDDDADAEDFDGGVLPSGTLTFAAGSATATITVPVVADAVQEDGEDFTVVLSNATTDNGAPVFLDDAESFGFIGNDDFPSQYGVRDVAVLEGDSGATEVEITFLRSGNTGVAGTVDYTIQPWVVNGADSDDVVGTLPITGTVSFAPGATSARVTLEIQGDTDVEIDEILQVLLSNPTAASGTAAIFDANGFVTILNDDGPVRFSAFAGSATEGADGASTPLTFTVTRSGDTDVAASVDYAFTGVGASAADFVGGVLPAGGTLEFAAGQTSQTVTVDVADDMLFENTEYLRMTLSNAATPGANGAQIDRATTTGTIFDNEVPVYYRVGNGTVTEGEPGETTTMTVTVTRSGDTSAAGSVDYAVTPYLYGGSADAADFVGGLPIAGTVNFGAGQTSQSITIDIAGDDIVEGTEYFDIRISNATSADPDARAIISDSYGFGTIRDDDIPVYFRAGGGSVTEGDSASDARTLTFTITRFGETDVAASVGYDIAGGTADAADFDSAFPTSGTVSFAAGETQKTVTLQISEDLTVEPDEVTYLTLKNPASSAPGINAIISGGTAAGTIRTDDFPAIISVNSSAYVEEGDTPADNRALIFTVTRSGDLDARVTMDWAFDPETFNGLSADDLEGGLPQGGTLDFAAGVRSQTVRLNIAEDSEVEANERGRFTISNVTSPDGGAVRVDRAISYATVANDDAPPEIRLTVNGSLFAASVIEGPTAALQIVPFVFERTGDLTDRVDITFDLLSDQASGRGASRFDLNDTQIPQTDLTITIAPGQASATFSIPVSGDFLIEPDERLFVRITEIESQKGITYGLPSTSAFLTIINDDGRPPTPDLPVDTDGDGIPDTTIPIEADIFGDPHITTLDGLGYDFQAVGEYILVETEDGVTNPFSVQIRFEAFPGSDLVSVATRVAVELKGSVIEVNAFDPASPLLIDGQPPTAEELAAGAIDLDGDASNGADIFIEDGKIFVVLNAANEQLMIGLLEDALNVCVFLGDPAAGGNAGQVRGLMGNANQDLSDDFALRDGSDIPGGEISFDDDLVPSLSFDFLYGRGAYEGGGYRASWEVTAAERAFTDTAPDFPANFPAGPLTVDALPAGIREEAEEAAIASGLPGPGEEGYNETIFNAAVLDFALTGMGAFLEGANNLAAEPEAETEAANAPELTTTVGVSADAASITEGDAGLTTLGFTFYRIGDAAGTLEVFYEIAGDIDADDLAPGTPLSGSVGFEDGETEVTLELVVRGDLLTEADEALNVVITGTDVEGVLVGGAQGETVIETDDFGPAAEDDEITGANGTISGNLFDDNTQGVDSDADDDSLTVTRVFAGGETFAVGAGPITLPSGVVLTIDAATGGFSADTSGAFPSLPVGALEQVVFDYEISDGNGGVDRATVTLNVQGVAAANADPDAVDDAFATDEDTQVAGNVLADNGSGADSDPEGATLVVSAVNGSAGQVGGQVVLGSTALLTLNADGTFDYDPNGAFETLAVGDTATDTFTYTISDGNGFDTATATVTITGVNDAPEVFDAGTATDEDTPITGLALAINAVDVDGDDLTFALKDPSANGLVVIDDDGTMSFTPDANFFGSTFFTYTVSDGNGGEDEARFDITVNPVNDAPEAADDTGTTGADTAITFQIADLLANDSDPEGDEVGFVQVVSATNGSTVVNGTTSVTFTPTPGFSGVASFTYRVTDGNGGFDEATVTIDVTPPENRAPVAVADSYTTRPGQTLTVAALEGVLANDSDPDGDAIQVVAFEQAANGTVDMASDGAFTYTSDPFFVGTETLEYTISDGEVSTTGTFTLEVVNGAPVAVADSYTTGFGEVLTVDAEAGLLANDSDPDGDAIRVVGIEQAAIGTLAVAADGSLIFTPFAGASGTETLEYAISDGFTTGLGSVTLTVGDNPAPVAVDDVLVTDEDSAVSGNLLANDADDQDLSVVRVFAGDGTEIQVGVATALAGGGRITVAANGDILFDPAGELEALGFNPQPEPPALTIPLTYVVSDGTSEDEGAVSIEVRGVNDGPVAVDDGPFDATEGAATGPLDVLGNDGDPEDDALTIVGSDAFTALGGQVIVAADGITLSVDYTGVDLADLLEGETLADSFDYVISDGDLAAGATVSLTLAGKADDAPGLNPVTGTAGRDRLIGTDMADRIESLAGSDQMYGQEGGDVFVFGAEMSDGRRDRDIIYDFEAGIDSIELASADYAVAIRGSYALIRAGDDQIYVYGDVATESDLGITVPEALF